MKTESVIFEFDDHKGNGVIPVEGMKIAGAKNVGTNPKENMQDSREFQEVFAAAQKPTSVAPPEPIVTVSNSEYEAQMKELCDQARYDWMVLSQTMPVYFDDDRRLRALGNSQHYEGEFDFLDESTRQLEKQIAGAGLIQYCEDPDDQAEMDRVFDDWRRGELCDELRGKVKKGAELGTRFSSTALRDLREEAEEMCSGRAPLPRF